MRKLKRNVKKVYLIRHTCDGKYVSVRKESFVWNQNVSKAVLFSNKRLAFSFTAAELSGLDVDVIAVNVNHKTGRFASSGEVVDTPEFVSRLWADLGLDEETVTKLARRAFVERLNLLLTTPTRTVNFISVLDEETTTPSRIVRPIVVVEPREERIISVQVLWDMQLQGVTERKPFAMFSAEDCAFYSANRRAAASGLVRVAEIAEYVQNRLSASGKKTVCELSQAEQQIIVCKWQAVKASDEVAVVVDDDEPVTVE